jgi:alpha-ketoglutarate-dependent taurine dioxygenase
LHLLRTVEIALATSVVALLAYSVGSCGTTEARGDARAAHELAHQYRMQRDSTLVAQQKTDTVTKTVIVRDRAALAQRDSLISVLTYADSVFEDSLSSLASLRVAYAETRTRVTRVVTAYDSLQVSTRDLIAAHALERLAVNTTLAAADSTIAGYKRMAEMERRKRWHYRTQGALVGAVVALFVVVAL